MQIINFVRVRLRSLLIGVTLLSLAVVAAGAVALLRDGGAGAQPGSRQLAFADHRPSGTPVPLTGEQCATAEGMLNATLTDATARLRAAGQEEALTQLQGEITRGLAWVEAGCPPDPVRGFYPAAEGPGGELRLMDQQVFSAQGVVIMTQR
jgi:hypothetical protein